jgi:hypothetical protein
MKWSYILFLPALVSFLWALAMVLIKKHLTRAQLLQSLTFIMEGTAMVLLAVFFRGRAGSLFIYDFLFETLVMLCGPMYYMSVCSLSEPRGASLRQRRVFLFPLFFILGLTVGAFWLGPRRYELMCHAIRDGEAAFISGESAWNFMLFWNHILFPVMVLLLGLVIIIVSSRKTNLYQRRFNSYYADKLNAPQINTRWLTVFSWIFAPLALMAIIAVDYQPIYYKYLLILVAVLFSIVQYFSGHFCYHMDYDARYLAEIIRKEVDQ